MKYAATDIKPLAGSVPGYSTDRRAPAAVFRNEVSAQPPEPTGEKRNSITSERTAILPRHVVAKALETPALNALLPIAAGVSSNVSSEPGEPIVAMGQALLICSLRGRGWCEIRGRRHNLGRGELLVVPPGVPYTYAAERDCLWAMSWVQLAGLNLGSFLGQLGVTPEQPIIQIGEDARPPALFQELLDTIDDGWTPAHLLRTSQTLTQLFDLLSWQYRGQNYGETDAAQKISQSIDYMKQHLDQPLQVSALAASVNISQSHYFVLFKRLTGSTPIDYFIHMRMQRACHLLNTTSTSVKGVAAALGYDDQFYFSRLFRSVHGVAPREYRVISNRNGASAGERRDPNGRVKNAAPERINFRATIKAA